MTLEEFFAGYSQSRPLFDVLHETIAALGPAELQVTKSQVAFRRGKAFAWAWIPDRYLRGNHAPLVLRRFGAGYGRRGLISPSTFQVFARSDTSCLALSACPKITALIA